MGRISLGRSAVLPAVGLLAIALCMGAATRIDGTEFKDTLGGTNGNDRIDGRQGNDTILAGAGNDLMIGGAGRDSFDGGQGNDVVLLGKGEGQDLIVGGDSTPGRIKTVRFDKSVAIADIRLQRQAMDLLTIHYGRGDKITIPRHFEHDANGPYRIDVIELPGGRKWSADYIRKDVLKGTDAPQFLSGYGANEKIDGLGGNDNIRGGFGNDTVSGGQGNDRLYGDEGNDTLIGGPGSDLLRGEMGSDVYVYRHGDGMDRIQNYSREGDVDVVRFPRYMRQGVTVRVKGNDLLLLTEETPKPQGIQITNFNGSNTHPIARIEFREGPPIQAAELIALFPKKARARGRARDEQGRRDAITARPRRDPAPRRAPRPISSPLDKLLRPAASVDAANATGTPQPVSAQDRKAERRTP